MISTVLPNANHSVIPFPFLMTHLLHTGKAAASALCDVPGVNSCAAATGALSESHSQSSCSGLCCKGPLVGSLCPSALHTLHIQSLAIN